MDERKPQEPNAWGIYPNTCDTCKCKMLSSYIKECVECLKLDKAGDRFPLHKPE